MGIIYMYVLLYVPCACVRVFVCVCMCVLFRYVRMCVCAFLWSLKYEAYHLEIAHVFSAKVNEF